MAERNIAQKSAAASLVGVKSVKKTGNENVYCLATEKNGNFIANNIVIKNCDALRYAIYTHFFGKDGTKLSAADIDRMYNETRGIGIDLPSPFRDIPELDYRF